MTEPAPVIPIADGLNLNIDNLPPRVQYALASLVRQCKSSDLDERTLKAALSVAEHLVTTELLPQSRHHLRLTADTADVGGLPFTTAIAHDGKRSDVWLKLPGADKVLS